MYLMYNVHVGQCKKTTYCQLSCMLNFIWCKWFVFWSEYHSLHGSAELL